MGNRREKSWRTGAIYLAVAASVLEGVSLGWAAEPDPATRARMTEALGKLPLSFEANQGQADPRVKFLSRGPGFSLLLTADEAVLQLQRGTGRAAVRMKLARGKAATQVEALDELPGRVNYLLGNDRTKWRRDVPHYARVRYHQVSSGVDLVFHGSQRHLEYDLVVSPGADPRAITLRLQGARKLQLNARGDLLLDTAGGRILQAKPLVYQEVDGERKLIAGNYVLKGKGRVGFEVAAYDAGLPLVIDPTLAFFTFLGGSGGDEVVGVAVDGSGNLLLGGITSSLNFPTRGPAQGSSAGGLDVFVTKLGPGGNPLIFSTYLGGSGDDVINGIAVGPDGNAYVTGYTGSSNFPTASPFQPANRGGFDCFITKLNSGGDGLVYSTYLGGSADDSCTGIALDPSGNILAAGFTGSNDFPTASPLQSVHGGGLYDAFLTIFHPSGGALRLSTFLGGSGSDQTFGIVTDIFGNAYVAGATNSTNFPTTTGAFQTANQGGADAFVTKIDTAGNKVVYSTFLGGSGSDAAFALSLGPDGSIFVTGLTASANFPSVNAQQPAPGGGASDAFLTRLNADGSGCIFSTFLGGLGADEGTAVFADPFGNAFVTGDTNSPNFPVLTPLQSFFAGGDTDAILAVFGGNGRMTFSTYFGGAGNDSGDSVLVDPLTGNLYLAGVSGPCTPGQSSCGGGALDGFLASLSQTTPCSYYLSAAARTYGASGLRSFLDFVGVSAPAGCSWTAVSSDSWLAIDPKNNSGSGSGRFLYSVDTNPGPNPARTGRITVQDQTFLVTQTTTNCKYTWSPGVLTFGPSADAGTFSVTADPGCPWSATSPVPWISLSPATGTGSGTTNLRVGANPTGVSRSAALILTEGSAGILQLAPAKPNEGGTVGAAAGGRPAGGGATSLFGANLATETAVADKVPLPTQLGQGQTKVTLSSPPKTQGAGARLAVGPIDAPLFFVSANQINFQMPWEFLGEPQVSLTVTVRGATSAPVTVNLADAAPGIFSINQQGTGQGVIQVANTIFFAAPEGSIPGAQARPAKKGEFLTIYCTGLGGVNNRPASGAVALASPLSTTKATPTATIGGASAPVSFSGLTPGFVGLYQVNVQVPDSAPTGSNVQVALSIGGATSNTVTIAVQ